MSTEVDVYGPDTEVVSVGAIGAIVRSETESQLDAAHKYPRSIKKFLNEAIGLATFSVEIAESCMYSLPRAGKAITGPSVRLAEMLASSWGNLHIGARVVGTEDKEILAQGVAWDLEKNVRVTIEKRRRITRKDGRRFDDDMITVTGNAAASIGLRDAIFRVIPKAYVMTVYEAARKVAVGDASTLAAKRQLVMERLQKMGATPERILARIEKPSVEDIGLGEIEVLIGLGTAIKDGGVTVDEAFPEIQKAAPSDGKSTLDRLVDQHKETKKPESAAATTQPSQPGQGEGKHTPTGTTAGVSTPSPLAADQKPAEVDPEAKCTAEQFDELQAIANDNDVAPKVFISWVKDTLKYKMVAHMKQKDYERAKKFLQNGGKE